MLNDEFDDIRRRADAATPGPWRVEFVDDTYAMNFVAVTTGELRGDWPETRRRLWPPRSCKVPSATRRSRMGVGTRMPPSSRMPERMSRGSAC